MKKITKLLSVILAFVLVFSSASIAFAKEAVVPVILVHGLGGNTLYENLGTENETAIPDYGLDVKAMLGDEGIRNEGLKLLSNEKKPDYNKLFNAIGNYFKNTHVNCDENGDAVAGQGVNNYWTDPLSKHPEYFETKDYSEPVICRQMAKIVGKKNVYVFNYDWRLDVVETAKKLRKMIVTVKKNTGAKKVSLVGVSLGGAVLSAYMDAYKGKKDVARYVFVNPAIQGVDVSRMFELDIKFDKKTVLNFVKRMEKVYDGGSLETLFKAISALGDVRIGYAVNNLNKIAGNKKLLKKLLIKGVKPWIGNMPAYWECIPYSQFNKCMKTMSDIGFLDKSSGLYKKLKRYHKVQGRFNKNIKYAKKHGAQIAIIANYGIMGIPATSKAMNQTDVLIDTKYASGGATVAQYGKTLKGKKAKGKYVSPDKVINASTCVLPDNTWFIKGVLHTMFKADTKATKFIANLACGKVKCNLKAVKKKYGYSQFLDTDANQKLTNVKK